MRPTTRTAHLVANAHQGIVSSAYEPGPYSPHTEGLVDKFCNWYLDRLGAGLALDPATSPTVPAPDRPGAAPRAQQ